MIYSTGRLSTELVFTLLSQHWVIDVYRIYTAFVTNSDTASSAERFFMSMEDPRNVTRTWLFTVEMLTLDSLLVRGSALTSGRIC